MRSCKLQCVAYFEQVEKELSATNTAVMLNAAAIHITTKKQKGKKSKKASKCKKRTAINLEDEISSDAESESKQKRIIKDKSEKNTKMILRRRTICQK